MIGSLLARRQHTIHVLMFGRLATEVARLKEEIEEREATLVTLLDEIDERRDLLIQFSDMAFVLQNMMARGR